MLRQLWATVHLPLAEGVPELSECLLQLRIDGYRPRSKIFVLLGLFRELLLLLGDFGLQVAVAPLLQNEVVPRGVEEVEEIFLRVLAAGERLQLLIVLQVVVIVGLVPQQIHIV